MSIPKLTCPGCDKVLRPTKPIPAGKKIKCPSCETIFTAPEEEIPEVVAIEEVEEVEAVEEDRPRKPARKSTGKAVKDIKETAALAEEKDDSVGTYGYIKDPDDDKDKKPKIQYGPDTSVKDPRGPAIVKLSGPTGKLQLVGLIGTLGWVIFTLLIIFPAVFPIQEDKKDKDAAGKAALLPNDPKGPKAKPKGPPFFLVYGIDFNRIIELPWYTFMAAMLPFVALACYSACIVSGGIKAQNLESRPWGMVAAAMAVLPLNSLGLGLSLALVLHWLSWVLLDEVELGMYLSGGLNVLLWLTSAAIGGWCLSTLVDEEVIEGFTYEPE